MLYVANFELAAAPAPAAVAATAAEPATAGAATWTTFQTISHACLSSTTHTHVPGDMLYFVPMLIGRK